MGWKSNINIYFSKQILLCEKCEKCAQFSERYSYYIPSMFTTSIKIILECYNLLIDLVP